MLEVSTLEYWGWNAAFQQKFDSLEDADGLIPGRVIVQQRALYTLITKDGELRARLTGRFARDAAQGDYPTAGDWVAASPRLEEGAATIHAVLPRVSVVSRKSPEGLLQRVAANLDVAFLVTSLNGELNPRRLERYLAVARDSGAKPVIVLTKADQCDDAEEQRALIAGVAGDAPIHIVSAVSGEGMEAFAAYLKPGITGALLGSSGVGKSTLVNALAGEQRMATRAISGDDKRGRHTTTHRELILLPGGGLLLDSPGMRELGLWDAEAGVEATFADIEELAASCRFRDCGHSSEPGCAVRAALEAGSLDEARWESYNKLQRELAFEARKVDPKLAAEQKRHWIQIHKDARKRLKHKRGERDE